MPSKIKPIDAEEQAPVAPEQPLFEQCGELVVDVFETDADFVVTSAIAGVSIKNIDISLDKGMMVIKGDRQNPHEDSGKKYFYQECHWGPFARKIIMPENIDIDQADAQMDKGVLTIKIPKTASATAENKVAVKSA